MQIREGDAGSQASMGSFSVSRLVRSGPLGFVLSRFALFAPAAKIEGHGHASVAQLIGKSPVDDDPSHNHASYSQGSYALGDVAATLTFLDYAPLQHANHCLEDGLEGESRAFIAAR
jgi:hypothetical protein